MTTIEWALVSLLFVAMLLSHLRQRSSDRLSELFLENSRLVVAELAQVKGLAPHHSDPTVFSPSGRSWEAEEKVRQSAANKESDERRRLIRKELSEIDRAVAVVKARSAEPQRGDQEKLRELLAERSAYTLELKKMAEVSGGG